jgi:hypothetical protein
MAKYFDGFDLSDFWEDSEYARMEYVDQPLTDEELVSVEKKLGYTLPRAYVELCRKQNGGMPKNTSHRTSTPTSWADDHVAITGIYSIGRAKTCSLCGSMNSQFWNDEWGYPAIGVYFADCPSAGHDMLCLDYSVCGPTGEPRVVHVDQEFDYTITHVADNFEAFIRGLEPDDNFDD